MTSRFSRLLATFLHAGIMPVMLISSPSSPFTFAAPKGGSYPFTTTAQTTHVMGCVGYIHTYIQKIFNVA